MDKKIKQDTQTLSEYDKMRSEVYFSKYALKDNNGNLLEKSIDETFRRCAKEFARIEEQKYANTDMKPLTEEVIYDQLASLKIIPNGRPLAGIGNEYSNVTLFNCFIIPGPSDNYGSILKTDETLVQISKRGGGVGFDISKLRPRGYNVKNAANTSTGAVSFMDRFSGTINEVAQSGRRGALLIAMNIRHPDIMDFISVKNDHSKISGANISVKIDDEFMYFVERYLESGKDWQHCTEFNYIDNQNKNKADYYGNYWTSEIWNSIIDNNLKNAEPGLLFWDTIKRESILDCYPGYEATCTNPCGEIVGGKWSTCRLITLNLNAFARSWIPTKETGNITGTSCGDFNTEEFIESVEIATRLNDDLIDLDIKSIEKIQLKIASDELPDDDTVDIKAREQDIWNNVIRVAKNIRQAGIGVTGLADVFAKMHNKYGDETSKKLTESIFRDLRNTAYRTSLNMAKVLGAFPEFDYDKEKNNPYLRRLYKDLGPNFEADMKKYGRRNINLLTCPPAGTISIIAGVTSGIEPLFQKEYKRKRKINSDSGKTEWEEYTVKHPVIDDHPWLAEHYNESHEIDPKDKIDLLSIIQKYVDNSISSTTNMSSDTTREQISELLLYAWGNDLKGITVYVDGSRDGVLKKIKEENKQKWDSGVLKRPNKLECVGLRKKYKGVNYVILIGMLQGKPYEMFVLHNGNIDKLPKDIKESYIEKQKKNHYNLIIPDENGNELKIPITNINENYDEIDGLTRMISTLLRHNVDLNTIVTQLEKVKGFDNFSKSYGRMLKNYVADNSVINGEVCPECGCKTIIRKEGCWQCMDGCGFSVCK